MYPELEQEFNGVVEDILRIKKEIRNWSVRNEIFDIVNLELKKAKILRELAQRTRNFEAMEESFYIVFDLNVCGFIDPDFRSETALGAMKAAVAFWRPNGEKHSVASTYWHRYALLSRALRVLTGAKRDSVKERFR